MATTGKGIYYPTDYTKIADVPADLKQLAESVDKAIGDIPEYDDTDVKEDINDLKENDEQQDKDIETLQTKQTELETEIQELEQDIQSNAIIEETEKAKSLYIDDANASRGKVNVFGNMEQEIREGYNIYDYLPRIKASQGGLTTTKDEKTGYITINGTPTSDYTIVTNELDITDLLEDGQTYTLWQEKHKDSNTYGVYMQVTETTPDNTNNFYFSRDENKTFVVNKANTYKINIQTGSIANTKTLNNYKNRYMIYKGTDDKPFELYGATPSPQCPEIKVLESGSTEIKKICKNIMPIRFLDEYWQYTDKGIKNISRNNGTSITRINLKKGQTVKVGLKLFSKPTASASFTGYIEGKVNTNIGFNSIQNFNLNQTYTRTYTATEDCSLTYTLWGNANSDTFEFQMWAEFDTLTDYEQYKEETFNLDIQQDMLKGDYFIKEEDAWKEVHLRSKRNIKDDITNATLSGTNNFIYVSKLLQNTAKLVQNTEDANVISNIAQHESYSNISAGNIDYGIGISNVGSLIIRIKDCTTLEEYKDVLNDDSFYYYYYLATPTKLVCTDAQIEVLEKLNKLRYYEGVNNIFTTEDIALLQAKYSVDLKSKNNKMQQEIDEIKELLSTTQTSAMLLNNLEQDLIEEVK